MEYQAYEASGMVRGGKPGGDTWGTRWAGRRHMARVHKDWQTGFPYKCMGDQLQSHRKGGDLPVGFLQGEKSSSEEVANEAQQYNGFNLILADVSSQTMVYLTNRPKDGPVTVERVTPGLHVLSNARLDSPWPKVGPCGSHSDLLKVSRIYYTSINRKMYLLRKWFNS